MKIRNVFLILLVSSMIFACQSKDSKQKAQIEENTEPLKEDASKIMPNLPSPNEYAAILQSTGAEFNPLILNDVSNMSGYTAVPEKAMANLGIYFFDLGYSVAYGEKDYVDKYYNVCYDLSVELGVEKRFLEVIMGRYQENLDRNDSLKTYFREAYQNASEGVGANEEEKAYYRTLFLAGFYVEGLYNLLEKIEAYPKDILPEDDRFIILMPLVKAVLAQEDNIKTLADMLAIDYTDEDNDEYYANAFRDLISTYERLEVGDKIANNQGAELLKDEVMIELMAKVDMIRSEVVKKL